jgi:hypothetical protein
MADNEKSERKEEKEQQQQYVELATWRKKNRDDRYRYQKLR